MRPVEGTILTVARGAADEARAAAEAGKSLVDVAEASRAGAAEALARTPSLLPVLEQAGVVDAGGTGLLLLFDALLSVLDGRSMPLPPDIPEVNFGPVNPDGSRRRGAPSADDADAEPGRAPLRGDVPAGGARRDDSLVQGGVGRPRGLHRGGRRGRPVELPHPHR